MCVDYSVILIEAGRGVFLSCKRQKVVLPGTLLGLFPGVICDPVLPVPETPSQTGIRPYLLRFDGFWLDHEQELPYPLPEPGTSYDEFIDNFAL